MARIYQTEQRTQDKLLIKTCVRVWGEGMPFLIPSPAYFLSQVFYWTWRSLFQVLWLPANSEHLPVSAFPVLGLQTRTAELGDRCCWAGGGMTDRCALCAGVTGTRCIHWGVSLARERLFEFKMNLQACGCSSVGSALAQHVWAQSSSPRTTQPGCGRTCLRS